MTKTNDLKPALIARERLLNLFPTHHQIPEFWEHHGRAVATFGFLEETLGKAIFALTATMRCASEKIDAAYEKWLHTLERALTDPLGGLVNAYEQAANKNPQFTTENVSELAEAIREASQLRNVLCHGSWRMPDANGVSLPSFLSVEKRKSLGRQLTFLFLCKFKCTSPT